MSFELNATCWLAEPIAERRRIRLTGDPEGCKIRPPEPLAKADHIGGGAVFTFVHRL